MIELLLFQLVLSVLVSMGLSGRATFLALQLSKNYCKYIIQEKLEVRKVGNLNANAGKRPKQTDYG